MTGHELLTAAQGAAERGISSSRMRDLIAEHGVVAISRQPGRTGANLYPSGELRAIPASRRGVRHDLTGRRIGEMFAAARVVAEARGATDEHGKLLASCLAGNPASVRLLTAAAQRWCRPPSVRAQAGDALRTVLDLAAQLGDLPEVLPVSARSRVVTAEAAWKSARRPGQPA